MNYYNEFDPNAAAWLRELIAAGLIPAGDVDERSICDVSADDVRGYVSCHWFAGIGGWAYAARLAGWPDDKPIWSASAPCQPFSCAGVGKGTDDERHLWPELMRLIEAGRPPVVIGEQVASADVIGSQLEAAFVAAVQRGDYAAANRAANRLVKSPSLGFKPVWVDGIQNDLERIGYTCGTPVLAASSVGAPHKRQRLYWLAESSSTRTGRNARATLSEEASLQGPGDSNGVISSNEPISCGANDTVANTKRDAGRSDDPGRRPEGREADGRYCEDACPMANSQSGGLGIDGSAPRQSGHADQCGEAHALGNSIKPGLEGHSGNGDDRDQPGRDDAGTAGPATAAGGLMSVGHPDSAGWQQGKSSATTAGYGSAVESAGSYDALGNSESDDKQRNWESSKSAGRTSEDRRSGPWDNFRVIQTRDGKFRRISDATQPVFQYMVDGLYSKLGDMRNLGLSENEVEEIKQAMSGFPLAGKIPGRVMLLKGAGNAIVPELAAEFIRAYMAVESA